MPASGLISDPRDHLFQFPALFVEQKDGPAVDSFEEEEKRIHDLAAGLFNPCGVTKLESKLVNLLQLLSVREKSVFL